MAPRAGLRTSDPAVNSRLLYRLSYRGTAKAAYSIREIFIAQYGRLTSHFRMVFRMSRIHGCAYLGTSCRRHGMAQTLIPECIAAMPPDRLRYCTRKNPAVSIICARRRWFGNFTMLSTR